MSRWPRLPTGVVAAGAALVAAALLLAAPLIARAPGGAGGAGGAGGTAPSLSPPERAELVATAPLLRSVPAALAEVPSALADAAGCTRSTSQCRAGALRVMARHPDVTSLLAAVERPALLVAPLTSTLELATVPPVPDGWPAHRLWLVFGPPGGCALVGFALAAWGLADHRRRLSARAGAGAAGLTGVAVIWLAAFVLGAPWGGASLWSASSGRAASSEATAAGYELATLQQVYAEVVPAVQYAGAAAGRPLSTFGAEQLLARAPALGALQSFSTGLDQLYGAGVLAEQAMVHQQAVRAADRLNWRLRPLVCVSAVLLAVAGLLAEYQLRRSAASARLRSRPPPASHLLAEPRRPMER